MSYGVNVPLSTVTPPLKVEPVASLLNATIVPVAGCSTDCTSKLVDPDVMKLNGFGVTELLSAPLVGSSTGA
jgi:hypothetical protein